MERERPSRQFFLRNLYTDEELADVKLSSGDSGSYMWAHKLILAQQSPVFKRNLYPTGWMFECGSRMHDLWYPDVKSVVMCALVEFIYTGQFHLELKWIHLLIEASIFF
ncbi:hypothetical protein M0812_08915 [Anaeramoeba flamelloides]|uniref:BTB domain-containing protein n=1 Tax=Anaeramoeba flamelloides TaxID=1746091 RepID=A0AAV7ZXK6_9EUKA|nr:hypothetical protein M0812_20378 [Anaeramoeba flamelloides]KAJ3445909.1 hypothetical protein M0812_08915 [Anaeramoeba flamelloides]